MLKKLILILSLFMTLGFTETDAVKKYKAQGDQLAPEVRWMYEQAKWGLGHHFLAGGVLENAYYKLHQYDQWNYYINKFDVEKYADTVKRTGARFVIFTITQNRGYLACPSKVWDKNSPPIPNNGEGYKPQKGTNRTDYTPTRDLVLDLAKALRKRKIRLIAYLPAHLGTRWTGKDIGPTYPDWYTVDFITELSKRWGRHVSGWWFDGFLPMRAKEQKNGFQTTTKIWNSVRSGNPKSLVTFNPTIPKNPFTTHEPYSQFVPGEQGKLLPLPPGRVVNGWKGKKVQWFAYTFLNHKDRVFWGWGQQNRNARFSAEEVAERTYQIYQKGGVSAWDMTTNMDGSWKLETIKQLQTVGLKMQTTRDSRYAKLQLLNNNDSRLKYEGDWQFHKNRRSGEYHHDIHVSTKNGSSVSLEFEGPSFIFASTKTPSQGQVEIFIDGQSKGVFNTKDKYRRQVQAIIFETHKLSKGKHTVKIVKRSGERMLVDIMAFREKDSQ